MTYFYRLPGLLTDPSALTNKWLQRKVLLLTRMVWVIAFSSPDSLVISSISLCDQNYFHLSKFRYRDYSCYRDKVNRAAGLRAIVMVFASPFRQLYLDGTTPARLSGLRHLDSLAWTRNLSSVYRVCAKTHANPDPSLRSGQAPTATTHTSNRCGACKKTGHNRGKLTFP